LALLREHETELHARGVLHAGVFGSVARGEDDERSDIDVIVDVKLGTGFGLTGLIRLQNELAQAFGRSVDVISKDALKSPRHDRILSDVIEAF
jgi:predicted nucleotidyltransferase